MDPIIVTTAAKLAALIQSSVRQEVSKLAPRFRPDERDRPSKSFLTNAETQEYLGLSKATLARYRADGTLPYSKVGQSVYYKLSDVEALLERSAVASSKA